VVVVYDYVVSRILAITPTTYSMFEFTDETTYLSMVIIRSHPPNGLTYHR
jgi:hypothetical protein